MNEIRGKMMFQVAMVCLLIAVSGAAFFLFSGVASGILCLKLAVMWYAMWHVALGMGLLAVHTLVIPQKSN